jgi:hypothetical protein
MMAFWEWLDMQNRMVVSSGRQFNTSDAAFDK